MTEEFVYVIGTPGANTVKIGRSIDVARRLADIQRMSPVPLEVLWTTPGGHELETALHRHFRPYRSHGEWFAFHRPAAPLIQSAVEDEPWLRPKVKLKKTACKKVLNAPAEQLTPSQPLSEEARARLAARRRAIRDAVAGIADKARAMPDPTERHRYVREQREQLSAATLLLYEVKAEAVRGLKVGRSWAEVGALLGVTRQRAEQLAQPPRA
ncbi:GIY-YIG nuclease family protein [Streptomyces xiamenensis]